MSVPSKSSQLGPSTEATTSKLLERAQSLLARCLILLDNIVGPYFYEAIGSSIIPSSLSNLLCITDTQLMAIYLPCGFYSVKRNHFIDSIFQAFIEAFDIPIGITRYRDPKRRIRSLLIKIGQGAYPAKPLQQKRDQLQPPIRRFYQCMEDTSEKLRKIDRLMDAVYCHLRDNKFQEESK